MTLTEQKHQYLCRLQELTNEQQTKIDNEIAEMRAKFEAETIQPYRAKLEAEKVTPEMKTLVTFISYLDEMISHENNDGVSSEVAQEDVSFLSNVEENECECEYENECDTIEETENELTGTGFEAISQDIADTKAKIQSAVESRAGMPSINLPRRG